MDSSLMGVTRQAGRLGALLLCGLLAGCSSAAGTSGQDAPGAAGASGGASGGGNGGEASGGSGGAQAGESGAGGQGGGVQVGGSGAGAQGGSVGACGGTFVEGKRLPASLLFVVDYSWSMCQDPSKTSIECANPADKAKWSVLTKAMAGLIDTLPGDTGAGLVYYPDNLTSKDSGALCKVRTTPHVPIQLLAEPGQRDALKALPPQMNDDSPVNQTPTAAAAGAMVDYLLSVPESELPGARFLVLITDGKATCGNTAAQLQAALQKGAAGGLKTFVIGVPGSAGYRTELSQAAAAGGTAPPGCSPQGPTYCHFDMTSYTEPTQLGEKLSQTLEEIRGKVAVSCDYEVPPDSEVGLVNVLYQDGNNPAQEVGHDPTCKGNGWRYDDPQTPGKIILCDATCQDIQESSNPKLTIQLGCPTVEIK